MSGRAAVFALVGLALASATCVGRATQVLLYVDSNAPPDRPAQLTIASRFGATTREEFLSLRGEVTRIDNSARPIFAGSVGLVPSANGPRRGVFSVWAVLELPASAGQPAQRVERLQRLQWIERVPQLARMYFNVACAAPATGCAQSPPERCTLSALCIERGQTCGDEGTCVAQELPTQEVDPRDAQAPPFDASAPRADAAADVADVADVAVSADADAAAPIAPPRLIAPMSTSRVSQRRPTLRFEANSVATESLIELCSDRAMSQACSSFSTASSSSATVPTARPRGWTFWRVTARRAGATLGVSPVWQFNVGSRDPSAPEDTVLGKLMDLNGDGRADLVVSSQNPDEVAVYNGAAGGFADTPSRVLAAPAAAGGFGRALDAAGDVNGDGFGDLVIGAPALGAGFGYVYFGSATGVGATPSLTLAGVASGDEHGAAVAGAGDVNGDGFGDVVIGAPNAVVVGMGNAGTATVYLGRATALAPSVTLRAGSAGERFGASVTGGGDINGDGFSDVLVGAPRADPSGMMDAGEARAFLGGATGVSLSSAASIVGQSAGDGLGFSVAMIGDFNGDAAADAIAGAPNPTRSGNARLGRGSIGGTLFATQAVFALSTPARDGCGTAVSSAGDVNNDGLSDFIFTAPLANFSGARSGVAGVCLGVVSGVRSPCEGVLRNSASGEQLGESAAAVGDVNGDGFDDIVVGAPSATRGGRAATGYWRLYLGSGASAGVALTHAREVVGARANQRFSSALGGSTR